MGELLDGVTTPSGLAMAAASAGAAATLELIEASRKPDQEIGNDLRNREVTEILSDALQSALAIELEANGSPMPDEERELKGQLLAAVKTFLEGWAS